MNLAVQASVKPECLPNQKNNQGKTQGGYPQLLYLKNKQERQKRKDQPWRRLATINKIAQKAGYNLPNYFEKRTIAELLQQHGEYSYLTGKHLGNYYLSTLDIDIKKEDFPEKLTERLEKNTACLLDYLQVSYDKTKKGLHIDILTPKPLSNGNIYRIDKLNKKWIIGSIQSLGKYVVGEDKNKAFIKNGKWYWIVKNNEEIKIILNTFFFNLNGQEKAAKNQPENHTFQINQLENLKTVRYQAWDYNLNKSVIREYSLIVEKSQKEPQQQPVYPVKKHTIQAKILSKEKVLKLEHMWKVFYLDWKTKKTGYFLINDYHREREFNNLNIGAIKNMVLTRRREHFFFSKIL